MSLHGMDVESGRRLSEELDRAGERLLALSASLTPAIAAAPWAGQDGQRFKDEWAGHRQRLTGAGNALKAASGAVRRNVEEQLEASNHGAGPAAFPAAFPATGPAAGPAMRAVPAAAPFSTDWDSTGWRAALPTRQGISGTRAARSSARWEPRATSAGTGSRTARPCRSGT